MKNCLAIDIAKSKNMVTLVSYCDEILIEPYEINHSINDFSNLLNKINKLKLNNILKIITEKNVMKVNIITQP